MRGFNGAKARRICCCKIKSRTLVGNYSRWEIFNYIIILLLNYVVTSCLFSIYIYYCCYTFKCIFRILSRPSRASSPAGVDKFHVRAGTWKSRGSESRNSKSNKFAVTASAWALIRDRSSDKLRRPSLLMHSRDLQFVYEFIPHLLTRHRPALLR